MDKLFAERIGTDLWITLGAVFYRAFWPAA